VDANAIMGVRISDTSLIRFYGYPDICLSV
jgi:hypothetical protein